MPTVTIAAVGDISFHRGVAKGIRHAGPDWPFDEMRQHLADSDLTFGNLESVFASPDYPADEIEPFELIAPVDAEQCARALARAGFDFLNLAQNHVLDAGTRGMLHTKAVLESAGISTGGVGSSQAEARRPVVLARNGLRVGLLCYCEDNNYSLGTTGAGPAYYSADEVVADIEGLRSDVDVVVVSVHADLEFMPTPSPLRRAAFRSFCEAGAALVLGHHPHVPQGCERIGASLIAYSLGNFVFPAHTSPVMKASGPAAGRSFLLKARFSEHGLIDFERIPFSIASAGNERPVPLDTDAATLVHAEFARLDALAQDDSAVMQNWRHTVLAKLAHELRKAVVLRHAALPFWKRAICRLTGLAPPAALHVDVDRVLNELVGRLSHTAENRAWVDEVLRIGQERWSALAADTEDAFHRPSRIVQARVRDMHANND